MADISQEFKEVTDVDVESDKEIVEALEKLSCKNNTVFLSMIAPYVNKKITPNKEVSASIGLSEEFGIETFIEKIEKGKK